MGKISLKLKIVLSTAVLVVIGFVIIIAISLNISKQKISDSMSKQFVNEGNQVGTQAEIILANGGGTEQLQSFVESTVKDNSYIAYAVVIDSECTAIAHSDTQKIGKNYLEGADPATSAEANVAQRGNIECSKFWADVQQAWTYDVMVPIYSNGQLFGAMDIGIFNSEVDTVISDLQKTEIPIAAVLVVIICAVVMLVISILFKVFNGLIQACEQMGNGDLTGEIDEKILSRTDEVGKIANSMQSMKQNLSHLLKMTNENSERILSISEQLNVHAENTRDKATDIVGRATDAVSGTESQSELSKTNSQMTEEISKGMDEIANNIMNVTDAASETVKEAIAGNDKLSVVVDQMGVIEQKVTQTFEQIQQLEKMSSNIENVVNLIADISSQTNLLALNASIEAARAGEQGKGFAVVADEVGKLAVQSREAAEEIGKIIADIQHCIADSVHLMNEGNDSVKEGMGLAQEAQDSFEGIKKKITSVSNEMTSVAAVTEEVTSGTATLCDAIEKISGIADSVNESTKGVSDVAKTQEGMMKEVINNVESLNSLAESLRGILESFRISEE